MQNTINPSVNILTLVAYLMTTQTTSVGYELTWFSSWHWKID